MRLGDIIEFRKDLYFEGAVQADWFYDREKAAKVAENFVFHSKDYFGVEAKKDSIDTVSLVMALAAKFGKDSENPRSLAIADYGTGKSHLAVTLAVLFSGPLFMPETYQHILANIRMIDHEAATKIEALCKDRNLVIMLNGIRDFNLHSEILKATQRSLRLYGIDDSELRKINRTIDTASRFFDLNAQSQLETFEIKATQHGWHEKGTSLINRIREGLGADDDAFEIINDVYETITGQRIRWEEGISAKSILEMLLSRYCGLNGSFDNVIILFDEFGRFLEYASGTDGGKCGDNALQEIFEVSQNAAGALQIINFIQTDIKTYLLRVDQSRNLSRYIGRYDESEKYHISSNLETVFANLIHRKDKEAFKNIVINWQTKKEEFWKDSFEKINRWLITKGMWKDYKLYRKVVIEGIYPMHPLATFMLTQLSDYLQNRSSLTLISQYMDALSPAAELIGAVNTIVNEGGILTGHNTDGEGFVLNLADHGVPVKGKRIAVAGAGGAATAISVQCALSGAAELVILQRRGKSYARALDTAEKIRAQLTKTTASFTESGGKETKCSCDVSVMDLEDTAAVTSCVRTMDILINATNLGMKPLDDQSIIRDVSAFHPDLVVADAVYNPVETKLLREAAAAGCRTVDGRGMLLWQGAAAFRLFTGQEMPADEVKQLFFERK